MSSNRNPVSQWFITFPQCGGVAKQDFKIPDYLWAAVAQESHEDGQPHLHALVCLSTKMTQSEIKRFYDENYPDDCKRIHYKPTRNLGASATYISKEDKEPLLVGSNIPSNVLKILKVEPQIPTKWYNRFDEAKPTGFYAKTKRLLEERVCSLQLSPEEAHHSLMTDYDTDDAHDYRDAYWMDTRFSIWLFGPDYQPRNYYDRVIKCGLKK